MKSKKLIMTLAGVLGVTLLGVQLLVSKGEEQGVRNNVKEELQVEAVKESKEEEPQNLEEEALNSEEVVKAPEKQETEEIETAGVAAFSHENSTSKNESVKTEGSKENNIVKEEPGTVVPQQPATPTPDSGANTPSNEESSNFIGEVEQAIFNLVNEERSKAGLSQLSYNSTMEKYARIKSKDMGDNNYFSHEDLSGNMITTRMQADGVFYNAWAENIAYIGGSYNAASLAQQFMTNWMNSSGHRANILSSNFSSIGVGVYKIGNKVYATQEFYR